MGADSGQPGNLVTVNLDWAKVNLNSGIHALLSQNFFFEKRTRKCKSKVYFSSYKTYFPLLLYDEKKIKE